MIGEHAPESILCSLRLEARDRYFPRPGETSEEFTRFFEQRPEAAAALEKWDRYSQFESENDPTTDYVVVTE